MEVYVCKIYGRGGRFDRVEASRMGNANDGRFAMVMNRAGTVVIPMLCTEDIDGLPPT